MAILSTLESTTLDEMCSKMIHFNIKMQNMELVNFKSVTYAEPIPLSLRMYGKVYFAHSIENFLHVKLSAYSFHFVRV